MISIKSNKMRWAISAVFAILILFGTYRSVFSLAAFLGCCLMIFFCNKETILLQLFFVMPMANIFKFSPETQSFFTILLLLYIVLHLVLPRKATLLVILFAVYVLVGELFANQFNLFRTIKLICNILFLSSILNCDVKIQHKEVFFSYIAGNIVSSVIGLMDSNIFKIVSYVGTIEIGNPEIGKDITRFSGLYGDPNYYAVGLIISLCLLFILYHRKEIKIYTVVIFLVPIIYFLVITYSKSAIIMLLFSLVVLLYSLYKNKKYFALIFLLVSAVVLVCLALSGQIEALEIVLARMSAAETSEGVDVNALTTGRLNLWIMYAEFLIKDFRSALFGVGIGTALLNGRGAHNTYLDIFYYLGVTGSFLLISSLILISKQSRSVLIKRNFLNYSILLCITIMYFFLSELFFFDLPFHLFLAFIVLNLPLKEKIKI